jgi:DNA-binding NtrC family response regulator
MHGSMSWERISTLRSDGVATNVQSGSPLLVVLHGPDHPTFAPFALHDGTWNLGRAPGENAIPLHDARVSRQHARLRVSRMGTEILLEDQSANGTFVDGKRMERARLDDGAVIRVGDTLLLVRQPLLEPRNAAVEGMLGAAPSVCALRHDITRVAPEDGTVLVYGERGAGKELVAQSIHRLSRRAGAFVAVSCAGMAEAVLESMLFGHLAGTVAGASHDHEGAFRAAHGGTLFIDDVCELSLAMQGRLVRALETGMVTPIGSAVPVSARVRLVCAARKDLRREVEAGRFRGDLFARISQLTLRTPPLRERREDILPLLREVLGEAIHELPSDVVEALVVDPWRYNVRELLAVARRIRVLGVREGSAGLSLFARKETAPTPLNDLAGPDEITLPPSRKPLSGEREVPPTREAVIATVEKFGGNIRRTADALGRSRKQVYRYMQLYGVDLETLRKR